MRPGTLPNMAAPKAQNGHFASILSGGCPPAPLSLCYNETTVRFWEEPWGSLSRYAPFVQDFIYAHEWESLRGIQVAAGEAIFGTDDHVLLCASTASGKTEAAFFPILTEFWEDPPASVGALYIGPTKALINDQFYRLEELCEEAGIPVWHWHGDVSSSHKARLMRRPPASCKSRRSPSRPCS